MILEGGTDYVLTFGVGHTEKLKMKSVTEEHLLAIVIVFTRTLCFHWKPHILREGPSSKTERVFRAKHRLGLNTNDYQL